MAKAFNQASWLANGAIMAIFALWTLLVLPISWLLTPFLRRSPAGQRAMRRFIWWYGRVMLSLLRPWIPVSMGRPALARPWQRCIIICNHQSFLDIYLLGAQTRSDICLVSKGWPYKLLFFFAPAMRAAGYINVEELSPEQLEAVCQQRLREGTALVFFPEGSRSRNGSLGRFHAGAFLLAVRAGVPLCPLLIHNSFAVFPPGCKHFSPGRIFMQFLDPVFPAAFAQESLPHRSMLRQVRALYAASLNMNHIMCN